MPRATKTLPLFSRRHYQAIAKRIQTLVLSQNELSQDELDELIEVRHHIVADFVDLFEKDNPRFDRGQVYPGLSGRGKCSGAQSRQWRNPGEPMEGWPMRDAFKPISHFAVNALARLSARRAVVEELRGAGVRVTLITPAKISAMATEYLAKHPESFAEAHDKAQRFGMYDRPERRRKAVLDRHNRCRESRH
jgi:hypothetical protein